jgi:hypothetical protein
MWFSSGSCGLIVVLYQVAGVLPAQTYDRSWPGSRLTTQPFTIDIERLRLSTTLKVGYLPQGAGDCFLR